MTDLKIDFDMVPMRESDVAPVDRVYPRERRDLSAGEQLVIVGRYKKAGAAKVRISGQIVGKEQSFDFPANLVEHSGDESLAFVEKLWAIRRVGEILDELDLKGRNEELVKELVGLATRHGILTPYTSFLADETSNLRDVTRNSAEAGKRLEALDSTDGQIGVEQRAAKSAYKGTTYPAQAPGLIGGGGLSAARGASGGADKSAGGFHFAGSGKAQPAANGDEEDNEAVKVAQNVRNLGSKTFYRRGDRWVDSALSEEQQNKPIRIERFSPEYFQLIDRFGRDVARYMTLDEPLTVELGGKAYAF